jgi:ABC-type multidrug transport system permease subunit
MSLYRPGVLAIAQVIADLPMYFVPLILYCIVLYFLAGLKSQAGSFFIYFLFTYLTTCIFASFFRMVGYAFSTFEDASKVTGTAFNVFATYCECITHASHSFEMGYTPTAVRADTPSGSWLLHHSAIHETMVWLGQVSQSFRH